MQAARCSTVVLSCRRACLTTTSTFQRAHFAQERTEIQKTFRALIHSSPVTYEVIHDKKHNAEKKDINDVKKDLAEWEKRAGDAATRFPDWIERFDRKTFYKIAAGLTVGAAGATYAFGITSFTTWAIILPAAAFIYQGLHDIRQPKHSIRRNFPVLGNVRYLFESIRPEIRQYFIESDHSANPFSRTDRSVVYQRAKRMADTLPFGTRHNVYEEGYEWINHSIWPKVVKPENKRIIIGGPHCKQPYSASIFNISAMSHGSLSNNAIEALNTGAKYGGFYHNTGEGGISRFHLKPGGDIVWNVGTGYFGCRSKDGSFNEEMFVKNATRPQVKMIELKISQGAKPAHGGLLPKSKISKDIMEARGLTDASEDCLSPSSHSAFTGARGLIQFVQRLRDLSGGKPIGWKMCVGRPEEFVAICLAMLELDITPDFITIDGAEGGTGAAPIEYSNRVGTPLVEGLTLVDAILTGCGLRKRIKLISAGKIITGFHLVKHLALGADICNSARGMMFALGCIQALKCNTNRCPSGVATQDPELMAGLDIGNKSVRVYNFQKQTVETACELIGAVGLEHPDDLQPEHIIKRISQHKVMSYDKLYPQATHNCLLDGTAPALMTKWWEAGKALYETQRHQSPDDIRSLHQNISESR